MHRIEDIYESLAPFIDRDTVYPDADLNYEQGIDGDDFQEMLAAYRKRFDVDMSSYLWYFHAADEGSITGFGSWFAKPPHELVQHIPVTPAMLLQFANKGYWDISYPPHKLPRYRRDIIAAWIVSLICIAFSFGFFLL